MFVHLSSDFLITPDLDFNFIFSLILLLIGWTDPNASGYGEFTASARKMVETARGLSTMPRGKCEYGNVRFRM